MWDTFVLNFAAATSTREVADDSLKDTLYGLDVGGEQWLEERHAPWCLRPQWGVAAW